MSVLNLLLELFILNISAYVNCNYKTLKPKA